LPDSGSTISQPLRGVKRPETDRRPPFLPPPPVMPPGQAYGRRVTPGREVVGRSLQ
jgi:hypothetical protein